jgi:hypothetical protein
MSPVLNQPLSLIRSYLLILEEFLAMAGRAATALKSKAKVTKPRSASKAPKRKLVAPSAITEASESGSATATVAAPKPRRRVKAEVCTRIYWAVFNQMLKRVAVYEFDQKKEAEKRVASLIKSSGEHHFISKIKATVQKEAQQG